MLVAAPCIALLGLVTQQAFLRWTAGQELRQALITIAISVIIADQIIAHFPRNVSAGAQKFGGNAVDLTWPGWTDRLVDLHIAGVQYSLARLVMLAFGVAVAVGLWLWLYKTKTGMVIRAGVDDQRMASALGINIQRTFAIAFVVGSALAAVGAVVWASQSNIASGQDGQWLLNSLVVVIVGGMGSIFGAVAGALLYAFVLDFSGSYLPTRGSRLLHAVLAHLQLHPDRTGARFQAAGPVRKGRRLSPLAWTRKQQLERGIALGALVLVAVWPVVGLSTYWSHQILIQTFLFGIAAASLIFLSAYGGMVSLAQTAMFGIAGCDHRQPRHERGAGRDFERPSPRLGSDPRAGDRDRDDDRDRPDPGRGRGAQRRDLLPDDHADLLGDRDVHTRTGDEDLRLLGNRRHQRVHAGLDR